jgi:hypothetical protein
VKGKVKALEPRFAGDTWIELREEMACQLNALTLQELCGCAHDSGIVSGTAGGRLET